MTSTADDVWAKLATEYLVHMRIEGEPAVRRYGHVMWKPVAASEATVPDIVRDILSRSDGVGLFCPVGADPEHLGANYSALLYGREDIAYWTHDLRLQLADQLDAWEAEEPDRRAEIDQARRRVERLTVIGSTLDAEILVVDSEEPGVIIEFDHEVLVTNVLQPDGCRRHAGICDLIEWFEADPIRRCQLDPFLPEGPGVDIDQVVPVPPPHS